MGLSLERERSHDAVRAAALSTACLNEYHRVTYGTHQHAAIPLCSSDGVMPCHFIYHIFSFCSLALSLAFSFYGEFPLNRPFQPRERAQTVHMSCIRHCLLSTTCRYYYLARLAAAAGWLYDLGSANLKLDAIAVSKRDISTQHLIAERPQHWTYHLKDNGHCRICHQKRTTAS